MIEPLKKVKQTIEVPLFDHPMMSHITGTTEIETWDLLKLPERLNEVIEAVNVLTHPEIAVDILEPVRPGISCGNTYVSLDEAKRQFPEAEPPEQGRIVYLDPAIEAFHNNPDALSQQMTVFRHGGTVGSKKAIPFIELTPVLRKLLKFAPAQPGKGVCPIPGCTDTTPHLHPAGDQRWP